MLRDQEAIIELYEHLLLDPFKSSLLYSRISIVMTMIQIFELAHSTAFADVPQCNFRTWLTLCKIGKYQITSALHEIAPLDQKCLKFYTMQYT